MKITELLKLLDDAAAAAPTERPFDRKAFLEVALAAEIAWNLPLPSAPVASLVEQFETLHADLVKRIIADVNEMSTISVQVCYNLVVDLYKARYTIVYEPRLLTSNDLAQLLSRPAVQVAMTEEQKAALYSQYSNCLRSGLSEFLVRYMAPVQAG